MRKIKRGEIYYADLSPVVGSEQGGIRPVIILQNDTGNCHSPTTIVVAVTSKTTKNYLPTHIKVYSSMLRKNSVAMLEQIRTIDKQRILGYIGQTDSRTMQNINKAMRISLEFGCQNRYRVKNIRKEVQQNGIYRRKRK